MPQTLCASCGELSDDVVKKGGSFHCRACHNDYCTSRNREISEFLRKYKRGKVTDEERRALCVEYMRVKCHAENCNKTKKYPGLRYLDSNRGISPWTCKDHTKYGHLFESPNDTPAPSPSPEPTSAPETSPPSALPLPTLPPLLTREARLAFAFEIIVEEGCTAGEIKVRRAMAETLSTKVKTCDKCNKSLPIGRFSYSKDAATGERYSTCSYCYMSAKFPKAQSKAEASAAPTEEGEAPRECRGCHETQEAGSFSRRRDGSRAAFCKTCGAKWSKKMRRSVVKST